MYFMIIYGISKRCRTAQKSSGDNCTVPSPATPYRPHSKSGPTTFQFFSDPLLPMQDALTTTFHAFFTDKICYVVIVFHESSIGGVCIIVVNNKKPIISYTFGKISKYALKNSFNGFIQ